MRSWCWCGRTDGNGGKRNQRTRTKGQHNFRQGLRMTLTEARRTVEAFATWIPPTRSNRPDRRGGPKVLRFSSRPRARRNSIRQESTTAPTTAHAILRCRSVKRGAAAEGRPVLAEDDADCSLSETMPRSASLTLW